MKLQTPANSIVHKSLWLIALSVSLPLFAACGKEDYQGMGRTEIGSQAERITVDPVVIGETGRGTLPRISTVDPKPNTVKTESTDPENVRVLKADIYFKFEWAKRCLDNQVIPGDLPTVLDDVRVRAEPLQLDRAALLIKDILDLLQEGVDADALSDKEKADKAAVPAAPVKHMDFSTKKSGAPKREMWTPSRPKSPQDERDARIKLRATNSGVNLDMLKWDKFHEAGVKTSELAKVLNLVEDSSPVVPDANSDKSKKKKPNSTSSGFPR